MRALKRWSPAVLILCVAVASAGCGGNKNESLSKPSDPQAAAGQALVQKSCLGCHSLDGSKRAGPSFKGLAGSQVQLKGGVGVTADDAYLDESIRDPDAQIVDGYSKGLMTAAVQKNQYNEQQSQQIVAYIKTLK